MQNLPGDANPPVAYLCMAYLCMAQLCIAQLGCRIRGRGSRLLPRLLLGVLLGALSGCEGGPAAEPQVVSAPAAGFAAAAAGAERLEVAVVATGDLNGWVRRDVLYPGERQGLAYLAPLLADLRARYEHLVLLDAGDVFAGAPATTRAVYAGGARGGRTSGRGSTVAGGDVSLPPVLGALMGLRYDAAVPGNRDLALGAGLMAKAAAAGWPWTVANLVSAGDKPAWPPYRIVERGGVRLAVVGLTSPVVHLGTVPARLGDWRVTDLEAAARAQLERLEQLRKTGHVDLVVGLLHSGVDGGYDRGDALGAGLSLANAAGRVAELRAGFDLIVSGHAHRLRPRWPTTGAGRFRTPVLEAGSRGNGLAVAELRLARVADKGGAWRVQSIQLRTLRAAAEPAPVLLAAVEPDLDRTRQWLAESTAVSLTALPSGRAFQRCAGALLHRAAAHHIAGLLGLEEAAAVAQVTLLPMLWRGPFRQLDGPGVRVRRAHLFRWMPYENSLVRAVLSTRQVALLLQPWVRYRRGLTHRKGEVLHPGGLRAEYLPKGGEVSGLTLTASSAIASSAMGGALGWHQWLPVWLTAYHWYGGGGLRAKALLHPSQLSAAGMASPELTASGAAAGSSAGSGARALLREMVFRYLSRPALVLPATCGWLVHAARD